MTQAQERALIVGSGVLLSAGAITAEIRSDVDHNIAAVLVPGLGIFWSFLVAALVARYRRPDNRMGLLMAGVGFLWVTTAFAGAPNGWVMILAWGFGSIWAAALVHLVLAYPDGRLGDRLAKLIVAAAYLVTVVVSVFTVPFVEPRLDGGDRALPSNPLLVAHHHDLVSTISSVSLALGVVLLVMTLRLLYQRWRAATVAARRVLAPVYLTGGVAVAALGVLAAVYLIFNPNTNVPWFLFSATLAAVPQGFLIGLLRTQLTRSAAMSGLIADMEMSDEPDRLRAGLRRALGDPTLEVAYWLPDQLQYVNAEGDAVEMPMPGGKRVATSVERRGQLVARLVHDASLLENSQLIDAACRTMGLAMENERLAAELRVRLRELVAAEKRHTDLLENVRLIAVAIDLDGKISYANPYLCDLTGWSREEIIGVDWHTTFSGSDIRFDERVREDRVLPYEEHRIRTRGGDMRDIAWNNVVIRDKDGVVTGAMSIGEDITERMRQGRRLRLQLDVARTLTQAERLEDVAEPVTRVLGTTFHCWAAIYWKTDGETLRPVAVWNDSEAPDGFAEHVRSLTPGWEEGVTGTVWRTGRWAWLPTLTQDPVGQMGPPHSRRSGTYAFPVVAGGIVDGIIQLCSLETSEPDADMIALTEATAVRIGELIERRRAEQAVVESESRKSTILNSALDAVVTIDHQGRILEFNPAAQRTFGIALSEAIGADMASLLVPPALRDLHRDGFRRYLQTGEGPILGELVELTGMRSDGTVFPIELAVTRIDAPGPPIFTAFIRDITERKKHEAELRSSRARIVQAADNARRRLERNLHDGAQQRLVSLSLALRLALNNVHTSPDTAEQMLNAAKVELDEALEELRDLARGIHPAILTDRGLRPALEALVTRPRKVPVLLRDVPDQRLPEPVEAAAYYVVAESLTNVDRYADAETATVRVVQENGTAVIEVADDGVGGADPVLGSGLRGLADRVEALDGHLTVASAPGRGTTVRAVIPCG
jgi:PAS domain S-box-containing protein